jgi:hypothetical protein
MRFQSDPLHWTALVAKGFGKATNTSHDVKIVFMQDFIGTMGATDVFFKATWIFVLGLILAGVFWITCEHGQAGDDSEGKGVVTEQHHIEKLSPRSLAALHQESDITPRRYTAREMKAFREYEDDEKKLSEEEKQECEDFKKMFFSMSEDELVDVMGLSGMALLKMDASAGVSKMPLKWVLPLTALQAWLLQFCVLYYMARRVHRLSHEPPPVKDVPLTIIFAAIYLHFINCMNDLPFSMSILQHMPDLHENFGHRMVAMPIFIVDGLCVPFCSLFVGALYLCSSVTVSDVILNSCAVAFVSNVDNWLLSLMGKVNQAAGGLFDDDESADSCTVYIPANAKLVKLMAWLLCVVPVVPWLFSMGMAHLGLDVLHL